MEVTKSSLRTGGEGLFRIHTCTVTCIRNIPASNYAARWRQMRVPNIP